ncbi:MAG: helicase-associated domain-containing protein, partial [Anaerolinea sp.]
MLDLLTMLKAADPAVIHTIAETWQVNIKSINPAEVPQALSEAMRDPARAEAIYDALTDQQRGALQSLASAKDKQLVLPLFARTYGEFSRIGVGAVKKAQPHRSPSATVTDALIYRGLVGIVNKQTKQGIAEIVTIPDELLRVLPLHRTRYDHLEDEAPIEDTLDEDDDEVMDVAVLDDQAVSEFRAADTSLVDDMTTFLAYVRLNSASVEDDDLHPADAAQLQPFLIHDEPARLTFVLYLAFSAGLIDVQEARVFTRREGLQQWFGLPRWGQVKLLAEAWRSSTAYVDLFHVPSLLRDPQGFEYDPVTARQAILDHMARLAPARAWWNIQSFIHIIKESDPDFQRVDGDYDSWYLRDLQNQYLRGFESWDYVEGALIQFLLHGPLHWLGLVDVSEEAARLNAYGRAFVGLETFPQPPDPDERIQIQADGTAHASRKAARTDRFTLARMTEWVPNAPAYTYRFTVPSLRRAIHEQGITSSQIEAYLKKHFDPKPVPGSLLRMLQTAQQGALAQASIERLIVLQTLSEDVLSQLFNDPVYRQHLGRRLGPTACVVLAEGADALRQKLQANGVHV